VRHPPGPVEIRHCWRREPRRGQLRTRRKGRATGTSSGYLVPVAGQVVAGSRAIGGPARVAEQSAARARQLSDRQPVTKDRARPLHLIHAGALPFTRAMRGPCLSRGPCGRFAFMQSMRAPCSSLRALALHAACLFISGVLSFPGFSFPGLFLARTISTTGAAGTTNHPDRQPAKGGGSCASWTQGRCSSVRASRRRR
jgi:hypothetical protein